MAAKPITSSAASASRLSRESKVIMWVAGIFFALFGVLTIQYAYALTVPQRPWAAVFVYLISGYTLNVTELGMTGSKENFMHYRTILPTMSTHMLVGGLVVMMGLLQFVPSLRRSKPRLHRAMGVFLGLLMLLVCITSLHFLLTTPPTQVLAGVPFYYILFGLTLLPLFFLYQAAVAVRQKAFRDHMVWMGMAFACFLTAPLLRFNYAAVGQFEEQVINRLVLSASPSVLVQTLLLFSLWFLFVGQKDLPYRPNQSGLTPNPVIAKLLAVASMLGVISILLVAGLGLDHFFELEGIPLTLVLVVVAFTKGWQLFASLKAFDNGMAGNNPGRAFGLSTVASAFALVVFANLMDMTEYYAHALFYCLVYAAMMELIVLVLAYITKSLATGRHLFGLMVTAMSWSWLGVAALTAGFSLAGYSFDIALICGLALAPSVFVVAAISIAAKIEHRLRLTLRKPNSISPT